MLLADRVIAFALMATVCLLHGSRSGSAHRMERQDGGPGGGAFPFWLSLVMLLASVGILARSFISPQRVGGAGIF